MTILEIQNVSKIYQGFVPYEALKSIELKVSKGEFVSIMGPSGSGKTTLLNLIGTIDQATSGAILIQGKAIASLNKEEQALFRRQKLGFIFQNYNLLPTLTVMENIMLPLTLDKAPIPFMKKEAEKMMERLSILELKDKRSYELSGGESQRVAIARALINHPMLILADEPTGNLDSKSAGNVMTLLDEFHKKEKVTTLMVTHDAVSASYSERVIFIKDGHFYNEIYCGSNREVFYQKILDVLAHLGGTNHEFQTTRLY